MIIPSDPVEKQFFYDDLVRQCLVSRSKRFEFYQILRNYYLYGSKDSNGAVYNKIGSVIDTLASFIYTPDTVRFSIFLGETASPEDIFKQIPLAREVKDQWRMSATHLLYGKGMRWSLVYGTMLMKIMWHRGMIRSYLVEPHQFGVLREDIVSLADQEAFCMCYTTTRSQLESSLYGNPRKGSIMAKVSNTGTSEGDKLYADGMQRLVLGGPVGGVAGSVAPGMGGGYPSGGMTGRGVQYNYRPEVDAQMIDMVDLYVMDDSTGDYQLVTIASPDVIIYDRPQSEVGVSKIPHFVCIRPEQNLYDYFWSDSYVARLAPLQDWRSERIEQVRGLMARQYKPPITAIGLGGLSDEKLAAFMVPGGRIASSTPGGKVDVMQPQMPQDAFAELAHIDQMFDDVAGIGHIIQGKGEPGVRSKGQADLMARLGSSRPKNRAIIAEECAEDIATLILRNVQDHSAQRFTAQIPGQKEPLTFIAEQFTRDYEVKVDSHSSSPIFIEDRKHDAVTLLEAKAIDRDSFIEMFDPPNAQLLKEKLRIIEQKEAQVAQMQAQQAEKQKTVQ